MNRHNLYLYYFTLKQLNSKLKVLSMVYRMHCQFLVSGISLPVLTEVLIFPFWSVLKPPKQSETLHNSAISQNHIGEK